MTFEQLLKTKLTAEINELLAGSSRSFQASNDFNFSFDTDLNNKAIGVISSGMGTQMILQGTTAVSQVINLTILVRHDQLQDWLSLFSKYALSKIGTADAVAGTNEKYDYTIVYSTPSVVASHPNRNTSLIGLTGNVIYTDSLSIGGTRVWINGAELKNVLSLQLTSSINADSTTTLTQFHNSSHTANSDTVIAMTVSIDPIDDVHASLVEMAMNPQPGNHELRLRLYDGVYSDFYVYPQNITISSQTGSFDTMQISFVRAQ